MAFQLTRVGWTHAQIVDAEDMLQMETNIQAALLTHNHGADGVVAVDPFLIPAPSVAVGSVPTVGDHLANTSIHFRINQNVPAWYSGMLSIPPVNGANPEWSSDDIILPSPGFTTASYRVFANIHYAGVQVDVLPDYCQIVTEVIDASKFRLHARFVFNPFANRVGYLPVSWLAVGGVGLSVS